MDPVSLPADRSACTHTEEKVEQLRFTGIIRAGVPAVVIATRAAAIRGGPAWDNETSTSRSETAHRKGGGGGGGVTSVEPGRD